MTTRIKNMTKGSPARLLLLFSLPLIAGNIFNQAYTVADTMVIGRFVGIEALAAIGSATWVIWFSMSVLQGFAQGFSINVAQSFGAKEYKEMNRCIAATVTLAAVVAAVAFAVLNVAAYPLMRLQNTPAEIMGPAMLFIRVSFIGLPVKMAYQTLAFMLRAMGNSKTPFYAMIMIAVVSIILDIIFVVFFKWGIVGIAVALIIAESAASFYCFMVVRKIEIVKLNLRELRPDKALVKSMLTLSLPIAMQESVISFGGMVVQYVINGFGMTFIAGFTAANKLYGILEIAAPSYGHAMMSYTGQNMGAKNIGRIKKGVRTGAVIALVTSLAVTAVLIIFGKNILSLFIHGEASQVAATMEVAYRYLFIMSVFLPILYLLHIYRSALVGLGNTVIPMVSGIGEMICRALTSLVAPLVFGGSALFFAEPSAWTGAATILITAYLKIKRKVLSRD